MDKRSIGELNYETKLIVELLEQSKMGEQIAYAIISDLIGEDIHKRRYLLETAKRVVQREGGIVFDTIRGVGIVRVTEGGKGKVVDKGFTKIRRATRRTIKVLDTVDTGALQRDELNQHMQQRSVAGLLETHTKPQRQPAQKPKVGNKDAGSTVQQFLAKHRKPSSTTE
jgi:hypothetical protein